MTTDSALLVFEDGTAFEGEAFGYRCESIGEVVFNTSMSGYQEILTDPSYRGQLVTMTSVHIGNYGVNPIDMESDRVQVAGLIVRCVSRTASNYRATETLQTWLERHRVPGISGVDTRAITRHIRDEGAMMGAIVHGATLADRDAVLERIRSAPRYDEIDYVAECSVPQVKRVLLEETGDNLAPLKVTLVGEDTPWPDSIAHLPEVGALDFGVKYSILRMLAETGLRVTVFPHDTPANTLLDRGLAGILLSNGPGDPARLQDAVARIRGLVGQIPLFGICLGHQLLAQAVGGSTFKLKFGHRGPNQPVRVESSGRVQITSQNHGYAVRFDDGVVWDGKPCESVVTHINLNDQTVEGFALPSLNAFSLQHHPEAGPGPHDACEAFSAFRDALSTGAA